MCASQARIPFPFCQNTPITPTNKALNLHAKREFTPFVKSKRYQNKITQYQKTDEKKAAQNPQQRKGGYGTMKLSRYEQETIVNYNAGEQTATLYIRDKAVMRKLDALVADYPDT